jgi:2-iminobutanoate/2-iminopropanoate deaminase
MQRQVVTNAAQSAPGLLSQAIIANGFIFTAGLIHITPQGELIEGTVEEKLRQVMQNLTEVLKAANSSLANVVKVTIYVTDIAILPELNKYYPAYFAQPLPAREAVCVKELPLGASIEISMVATV